MVNRLEGSSCGRNSTKGRLLPCYQLTKFINSKLCEWCDVTKYDIIILTWSMCYFLLHDAMHGTAYTTVWCLSVCLSHSFIVLKWVKPSSYFLTIW